MKQWYATMEQKRAAAWDKGIAHREALVRQYMLKHNLTTRPYLREIIDDIIEDLQDARLRTGALPLDRYGQTEVVRGRIEVTINSRIGEMVNVKHVRGVEFVTKVHESLHVDNDMNIGDANAREGQQFLPGFEGEVARVVVCRTPGAMKANEMEREFLAENAARAAAIAGADLARCPEFLEFRERAAKGGELGKYGWVLLYRTADAIGVNITALVTYFQQRGFLEVGRQPRAHRRP